MTEAEQPPIVALAFCFGNEPCPRIAGIEIFDEHFRVHSFPILRTDGMLLEFRDNFFREQFHVK